jgi:pimeloyl-ACP methyl ester carboxylesterase
MGSGPPLLLAHGIGMSRAAFARVLEPLARDFEVVAVDLPGFGESPLDRTPTMRALADACAATMAGLGHERFHAAGNSLGGGVALHLALDGRALSACGLSPVGFADGWDRAWAQANLRLTYAVGGAAAALMRGPGRIGAVRRALVRTYLEHGERIEPAEFIASFEGLDAHGGYRPTLRHAINWRCPATGDLPCPVTIAWAEHDRLLLTGPQSARARERLPTARHVTLTDCGHLPAWDDPALVAETIRAAANA